MALEWTHMANWSRIRDHTRKAVNNGEVNGIGMRIVDVGEKGEFEHKWTLLDNEEEIFEHAIERCERQLLSEEKIAEALTK